MTDRRKSARAAAWWVTAAKYWLCRVCGWTNELSADKCPNCGQMQKENNKKGITK